MFKKPLSNLKTSAPLRSSDRRKLKQRLVASYALTPEEGDLLCPEGILSVKFSTHVGGHGVAYLDPETSDPLWFSLGKHTNLSESELIPSVYTLWKKQDLLPFLSTPAAVVPILVGGADLMIPGVVHCPPSLPKDALVAIRQYSRKPQPQASSASDSLPSLPVLSPPLAVGRLALPSDQLRASATNSKEEKKGKAVLVLHTWKDCLWDMGRRGDVPGDTVLEPSGGGGAAAGSSDEEEGSEEESDEGEEGGSEEGAVDEAASPPPPSEPSDAPSSHPQAADASPSSAAPAAPSSSTAASSTPHTTIKYTPAEISSLLTLTLHQAISTSLKSLPSSAFPIPATQFYSSYILPSRPAFPWVLLAPSSSSDAATGTADATAASSSPSPGESDEPPRVDPEITIKSSTHKSLTAFLKSLEKSSPPLLSLKPAPSNKSDVVVTAVNAAHPAVLAHKAFVTVGEVEARRARRAEREEREGKERERGRGEVEVREVWKAGGQGRGGELVEGLGGSKNEYYTAPQIRTLLNDYISTHNLVNPNEPSYISLDDLLYSCLVPAPSSSKGKGKNKNVDAGNQAEEEGMERFMRRDELVKKVLGSLQAWYEVKVEGREGVLKKGPPHPILISTKMRAGRKACTLISGFEPFQVIDAEEMAEELRRACAGSTSVSPIQGKQAGSGMEVLVQGKQAPAVIEYLMGKGIPKRWIVVDGQAEKKK